VKKSNILKKYVGDFMLKNKSKVCLYGALLFLITCISINSYAKPKKGMRALIIARSGLRVRQAPNLRSKTLYLLRYKTVVSTFGKTGKRQFIGGKWGYWTRVILWPADLGYTKTTGYVFSGFLFFRNKNRSGNLQYQYLGRHYPWLKWNHVKISRRKKGYFSMFVRMRNRRYKKVFIKGQFSNVRFLDYLPRARMYVFTFIPYCLPGPTAILLIDDRYGRHSIVGGSDVLYNPVSRRLITTGWGGYTRGSYMIYKLVGGRFYLEQKQIFPQSFFEPINAYWISAWKLSVLFKYNNAIFRRILFVKKGRRWLPELGWSATKNICMLAQSFGYSRLRRGKKGGYFSGNLMNYRYNISMQLENAKKNPHISKLLKRKNGRYTAWEVFRLIRMFFPRGTKQFFGKSWRKDYIFRQDFIRTLAKVYRVMLRFAGKRKLLYQMKQFAAKNKKNGKKPDYLVFYMKMLFKHKLDLRANVLHLRRVHEIIGFWIRRMKDGTAGILYSFLGRVFRLFDPVFYRQYYRGNRIYQEGLKRFPKARIIRIKDSDYWKRHYPGWGKLEGKAVTVVKRRTDGVNIDYLVTIGSQSKWVSTYYLVFPRSCGPKLIISI